MNNVDKLVADFKQLPRTVQREEREAIRDAIGPIAESAKRGASWSSRIPGAIQTRTRITPAGISASVRVSARKAPHARPHENRGRAGTFRKPVFADPNKPRSQWTWAPQRARPFLQPAFQEEGPRGAERLADAITRAARQHGWR